MKKVTRIFLWTLAIAALAFGAARIYYALTDDFRVSNITYEMPYNGAWVVPTPTQQEEKQLRKILGQTYTYLGKGAQSYAFGSEDGLYVIKFFKFKHLKPSMVQELLPPIGSIKTYKDKLAARKARKLFGVFNSYKLAYDVDRHESGLLFIQLNNTGNPDRQVVVRNKIGWEQTIDLAHVPFILQKRGSTLREVLSFHLKKGDVEGAEKRIMQIFDLYASEYAKGIYDHDHGVMYNTGFTGDQPFHLDVGKLYVEKTMQKKSVAKEDSQLVAEKIKFWIKGNYPSEYERLAKAIDEKVHSLFD